MRSWKRSLSSFPIAFPTNILECPYYYSIIPSHSSCTIVNINLDTFVTKITLSSIWNAPAAPALLVKLKPLPQENFLNHSSPNQLPVQLPAQLFKPWCQHKSAEDLVKMQILIQQIQGEAQDSASLTNAQGTATLCYF